MIALITVKLEKRRHGQLEAPVNSEHRGLRRVLRGPWVLVWGAVALAVPSAFALWGAKAASSLGVDVGSWVFWQSAANAKALAAPVWQDITSVMDIGIMLGALLAAGLAGRFAPSLDIPTRSLVAAVIGGLLLGYGRDWLTAATSARISAGSPPAVCTAGCGWSRRTSATWSASGCARYSLPASVRKWR